MRLAHFCLMAGLILCVCGCRAGDVQTTGEAASTVSMSMISPLEGSELSSDQSLWLTAFLTNDEGVPVEKAEVEAEVYLPDGSSFTRQSLVDKGKGRYLAGPLALPERGAAGTWHVVMTTPGNSGELIRVERAFEVLPSYSETYQSNYGFWINVPDFFSCHGGDQWFTDRVSEDGSGYVHMDNHCHGTGGTIVMLDVRWQESDYPVDETQAAAYVLAHHASFQYEHDRPGENLKVEQVVFQGQPAWVVSGRWSSFVSNTPESGGPVEWVIFRCPASDWLWTLVVSTNDEHYMDDLRELRETFECPLS